MTSGKPAGEAKEERISQWILPSTSRSIRSLELDRDATLGSPGANEVWVKLCAAGLNYRDLMIAKGLAPGPVRAPCVVPGSDDAGVVEAVGSNVKDFQRGDKVLMHLTALFACGCKNRWSGDLGGLIGRFCRACQDGGCFDGCVYGARGVVGFEEADERVGEVCGGEEFKASTGLQDFRTWDLDEVKRAYDWLEKQQHFSKVVIQAE